MKPAEKLWRISVATTPEAEDAVAELLRSALNCPAATYLDLETGVSTVSVFCGRNPARNVHKTISAGLRQIQNYGLEILPGNISITRIRRADWAESWKRHFRPIEIGGALLVKPSWSKQRAAKNQRVVILDPGLSFGTGQHPTTAFCLREIVRHRDHARRQSFLDLGTGSGILAIAAAKLGYQPVRALDCDAAAIRVAGRNSQANGVWNKMQITRADVAKLPLRPEQKIDLICANLTADVLLAARKRIAAQLNHGGMLVLAGILHREFPAARKTFTNLGLKLVARERRQGWSSGSFCLARKIL
jgi:ribosomal protein L11 methyltransferase